MKSKHVSSTLPKHDSLIWPRSKKISPRRDFHLDEYKMDLRVFEFDIHYFDSEFLNLLQEKCDVKIDVSFSPLNRKHRALISSKNQEKNE